MTVEIEERNNAIYLHSLEGDGDVAQMRNLVKQVKLLASKRKVYLTVDFDNPRKEQLMKRYQSLGAKPLCVLMEVL